MQAQKLFCSSPAHPIFIGEAVRELHSHYHFVILNGSEEFQYIHCVFTDSPQGMTAQKESKGKESHTEFLISAATAVTFCLKQGESADK